MSEKAGIESIVVNPASIEVAVNNRVKTDKRDALKMATLLEGGRLKGIRIPTLRRGTRSATYSHQTTTGRTTY